MNDLNIFWQHFYGFRISFLFFVSAVVLFLAGFLDHYSYCGRKGQGVVGRQAARGEVK